MRALLLVPLVLFMGGCLAPGERDPTRYPWDRRNVALAPHPPVVARGAIPPVPEPLRPTVAPQGNYCVLQIETRSSTGIVVGGKAPGLACSGAAPVSPPQEPLPPPMPPG
jgi:hypothetical protein